jgi:outer membrane protein assembly factor BamB
VRLDHNGKIEWRVKPGGGILSSPLCLEGDDLIVFGSKDTYIYAYSLSRGSLMWRAVTGGQVNGAAVSDGETILIGSDDGYIYALSLSGQIRWKRDLGGAVKSRPLIVEGTALITSYGARIYALNVQSGEITGEHRVDAPVYSSPIHDGTKVYFGSNDGTFHALWMYGDAS